MMRLRRVVLAVAMATVSVPAVSQDYPARPVRAIVVVGPGGTADIFARVLGEELYKRWGQPLRTVRTIIATILPTALA